MIPFGFNPVIEICILNVSASYTKKIYLTQFSNFFINFIHKRRGKLISFNK
jgi:hypothetical protein